MTKEEKDEYSCSKCGAKLEQKVDLYCDVCNEWHCFDCLIAEEGGEGRSYVPLDG